MQVPPIRVSLVLHDGREVPVIATYVDVIDGTPMYEPVVTDFTAEEVREVRVNGLILHRRGSTYE